MDRKVKLWKDWQGQSIQKYFKKPKLSETLKLLLLK